MYTHIYHKYEKVIVVLVMVVFECGIITSLSATASNYFLEQFYYIPDTKEKQITFSTFRLT